MKVQEKHPSSQLSGSCCALSSASDLTACGWEDVIPSCDTVGRLLACTPAATYVSTSLMSPAVEEQKRGMRRSSTLCSELLDCRRSAKRWSLMLFSPLCLYQTAFCPSYSFTLFFSFLSPEPPPHSPPLAPPLARPLQPRVSPPLRSPPPASSPPWPSLPYPGGQQAGWRAGCRRRSSWWR